MRIAAPSRTRREEGRFRTAHQSPALGQRQNLARLMSPTTVAVETGPQKQHRGSKNFFSLLFLSFSSCHSAGPTYACILVAGEELFTVRGGKEETWKSGIASQI